MNAEKTAFKEDSFDVIVGKGILHHLDIENSCKEISRLLKKDGQAVFVEPLGHNPIINLYRKLTPSIRTADEHPLLMSDIETAKKYFKIVDCTYFHILTFLAVPFRNFSIHNNMLSIFEKFDKNLMGFFPFFKRYAWIVVLKLRSPENPYVAPAVVEGQ